MKKIVLYVFLLISSAFMVSCNHKPELSIECNGKQSLGNETPYDFAIFRIIGTWQLNSITCFCPPTNSVPNYRVVFVDNQNVKVFKDNQLILTDTYAITENTSAGYTGLTISTTKTKFDNGESNFIQKSLRMCDDALVFDHGMAFDAPGYFFDRQ